MMSKQKSSVSGRFPAPEGRCGFVLRGFRDGLPICFGYFAVSFALGIAAAKSI